MEGVRVKFRMDIEPWILSADLTWAADQLTFLPRMIKSLTLNELKRFFRTLAKALAEKSVQY